MPNETQAIRAKINRPDLEKIRDQWTNYIRTGHEQQVSSTRLAQIVRELFAAAGLDSPKIKVYENIKSLAARFFDLDYSMFQRRTFETLRGELGRWLYPQIGLTNKKTSRNSHVMWRALRTPLLHVDSFLSTLGGVDTELLHRHIPVLSGPREASWVMFYLYGRLCGAKYPLHLDRFLTAMVDYVNHCGPLYYEEDTKTFYVVRWPHKIHYDVQGRLHNDKGPAVVWIHGPIHDRVAMMINKKTIQQHGLYRWHGLSIPSSYITHPITRDTILGENNTELRRVQCEIIGWQKAIDLLGATLIDRDECHGLPRKLYEVTIGQNAFVPSWGDPPPMVMRLIHVVNGTLENGKRREFIEGVPVHISTCHDAVAWQCGIPSGVYQEVRRT